MSHFLNASVQMYVFCNNFATFWRKKMKTVDKVGTVWHRGERK